MALVFGHTYARAGGTEDVPRQIRILRRAEPGRYPCPGSGGPWKRAGQRSFWTPDQPLSSCYVHDRVGAICIVGVKGFLPDWIGLVWSGLHLQVYVGQEKDELDTYLGHVHGSHL